MHGPGTFCLSISPRIPFAATSATALSGISGPHHEHQQDNTYASREGCRGRAITPPSNFPQSFNGRRHLHSVLTVPLGKQWPQESQGPARRPSSPNGAPPFANQLRGADMAPASLGVGVHMQREASNGEHQPNTSRLSPLVGDGGRPPTDPSRSPRAALCSRAHSRDALAGTPHQNGDPGGPGNCAIRVFKVSLRLRGCIFGECSVITMTCLIGLMAHRLYQARSAETRMSA